MISVDDQCDRFGGQAPDVPGDGPDGLKSQSAPLYPLTGAFIRSQPLLGSLPQLLADWLARRVGIRRLPRGTVLARQGEPDDAFYTVLEGACRVMRQAENGRSLLMAVMVPGDHFGECGLIDGRPRDSTVSCVEHTKLLAVSGADFRRCLAESDALRLRLSQVLSQRLRRSNQRIMMLALLDVRRCVLRHLDEVSVEVRGQRIVRGPVTRQLVADHIGASREMVGRVFKELAARGRIQCRQDGSLLLNDPATA